ncbi:cystatin-like [Denticeps clupeoides]|uniref:Cystatin domain-containing protein n=1 Tax=Denticeps clupeoides TaxID=299321 RepID=A0A8C4D3A7_9TELE|nr:cystatin-like [Denticeps clupeoides]XP_028844007.1 cystatin-like [Denticeps clupeoides]
MSVFWKLVGLAVAAACVVEGDVMVGGPMDVDINDQSAQNALKFAVAQHNKGSNDVFVSAVQNVIEARKQVVAGIKYIFEVQMARTQCKKGGVEELCEFHEDPALAKPFTCTFEVWSRPWMNSIVLLKNTCAN